MACDNYTEVSAKTTVPDVAFPTKARLHPSTSNQPDLCHFSHPFSHYSRGGYALSTRDRYLHVSPVITPHWFLIAVGHPHHLLVRPQARLDLLTCNASILLEVLRCGASRVVLDKVLKGCNDLAGLMVDE